MARAVLTAVRLTESSTLALDSELMKLEMLPPGQEATRIMPRAIVQLIQRPNSRASRKVSSGNRTSWLTIPRIRDLGLRKTSLNRPGRMPRATPYITKARTMLMVFMPPALSVTSMLSITEVISGLILYSGCAQKVSKFTKNAPNRKQSTDYEWGILQSSNIFLSITH